MIIYSLASLWVGLGLACSIVQRTPANRRSSLDASWLKQSVNRALFRILGLSGGFSILRQKAVGIFIVVFRVVVAMTGKHSPSGRILQFDKPCSRLIFLVFCYSDKLILFLYVGMDEDFEVLLEEALPEHIVLFRRLIRSYGLTWEEARRRLRDDGR